MASVSGKFQINLPPPNHIKEESIIWKMETFGFKIFREFDWGFSVLYCTQQDNDWSGIFYL